MGAARKTRIRQDYTRSPRGYDARGHLAEDPKMNPTLAIILRDRHEIVWWRYLIIELFHIKLS